MNEISKTNFNFRKCLTPSSSHANLVVDEEVPEEEVEDTLGSLQPTSTLAHRHLAPRAPPVNPLWRSSKLNIEFPAEIP